MDNVKEDLQLIIALNNNQSKALTRIYEKYFEDLYRNAKLILKDEKDAEDACYQVFSTLWEKRGAYEIEFLKAYLKKCAINESLRIKKEREKMMHEDIDSSTDTFENPEPDDYREELLNKIEMALQAKWGNKNVRVFRMVKLELMSRQEVARVENITVETVNSHIKEVMLYLRQKLNPKN
jgi:RNA polymerase sigma factor (sigma-70 family)